MIVNPGSFRDPLGAIYEKNNKFFRKVDINYYEFCKKFLSSNFQKSKNKFIVDTKLVEPLDLGLKEDNTSTFRLEYERVKLISYPRE